MSEKAADARIQQVEMVEKCSSSKTIKQSGTYCVLTLRSVVATLTLPLITRLFLRK